MTEQDAIQKWCPFARLSSLFVGSYNRVGRGRPLKEACCLGSDCMAWMPEGNGRGFCDLAVRGGE